MGTVLRKTLNLGSPSVIYLYSFIKQTLHFLLPQIFRLSQVCSFTADFNLTCRILQELNLTQPEYLPLLSSTPHANVVEDGFSPNFPMTQGFQGVKLIFLNVWKGTKVISCGNNAIQEIIICKFSNRDFSGMLHLHLGECHTVHGMLSNIITLRWWKEFFFQSGSSNDINSKPDTSSTCLAQHKRFP